MKNLTLSPLMLGFLRQAAKVIGAVVGAALIYLLIPITFSRYNDVKSLREARLAQATKFAERDAEFLSKIHPEATLLNMFVDTNDRMKIRGMSLRTARADLEENYRKRYLDIDASEWWWPRDFERQIEALSLLSPDEDDQLHKYILEYSTRQKLTIYQPIFLWKFLDSPKYKVGQKKSTDEITRIEGCMQDMFAEEDEARSELVQRIIALFVHSEFRTDWYHIVGPPQTTPTFEP